MVSDDEIQVLVRLVVRHASLHDVVFGILNDFAQFIEPTLPRCHHPGCKDLATIQQVDTHIQMCDHCAARAIILSRKNMTDKLIDGGNLLRIRCAALEYWVDLPNAEATRRLQGYIFELRKNSEPGAPSDRSELH